MPSHSGKPSTTRRTELGLSQTELARHAGMTQPQISTIEGWRFDTDTPAAYPDQRQGEQRRGGRAPQPLAQILCQLRRAAELDVRGHGRDAQQRHAEEQRDESENDWP